MRRIWLLPCVGLLLADAPSVMAQGTPGSLGGSNTTQFTYIYNADVIQGSSIYNGQILMNFQPILDAVRDVATAVHYYKANWAGIAMGLNDSAIVNAQASVTVGAAMQAAAGDINKMAGSLAGFQSSTASLLSSAKEFTLTGDKIAMSFGPLPAKFAL